MCTLLTDEKTEGEKTNLPTVIQIVKNGTVVHSFFFFFSGSAMPAFSSFVTLPFFPYDLCDSNCVSMCCDGLAGPIIFLKIFFYVFVYS